MKSGRVGGTWCFAFKRFRYKASSVSPPGLFDQVFCSVKINLSHESMILQGGMVSHRFCFSSLEYGLREIICSDFTRKQLLLKGFPDRHVRDFETSYPISLRLLRFRLESLESS